MALQISCLLILTGLTGISSMSTVRRVTVKAGNSVSIPCLYEKKYKNYVKYLCKGSHWYQCSSAGKTSHKNVQRFSISDDKERRVFTVTSKDLTSADTGHYWCAVEINGRGETGAQFYLSVTDNPYLYVDDQWITAYEGDNITIRCFNPSYVESCWCRLGGSCVKKSSGRIKGTRVSITKSSYRFFTVNMFGLSMESSGWYMCDDSNYQMPVHINVTAVTTSSAPNKQHSALKMFLIPLSLLIFLTMTTLLTWFLFKRKKQANVESSATRTEEEITYSAVSWRSETMRRTEPDPESDVIYTTVVIKQKQRT